MKIDTISFEALKDEGYVHIKSFLTTDELSAFKKDFEDKDTPDSSINQNYSIPYISEDVSSRIKDKIDVISREVKKVGIKTDIIEGGAYFCTRGGQTFPWHQDHESYYTWQNHHDYLNFYLPIIKPDEKKSNISVIPFSKLKARSPELFNAIKGKGAISYFLNRDKTKTYVYDDNTDKLLEKLDFNLKDISETPHLNTGDLLLMSGDLIHQTQDTDTFRVAASVRVLNSEHLVNYKKLINGGKAKSHLMFGNQSSYNYMISLFKKYGKNELSIKHFIENRGSIDVSVYKSRLYYKLYMGFLKFQSRFS